jgi:hypothetical protein
MGETNRHQRREVRRSRGNRHGQDRHQQGRFGEGPDGHGPAGAHPAEGRAGVEGAEGEHDRTEQQHEDDGEEIGALAQRRAGRRQRRDGRHTDHGGDQHQGTDAEEPTGFTWTHTLLGEKLAQVEQGLMNRRADSTF